MMCTAIIVPLLVLPVFVQLEIRVELHSEYCRYDVMPSYGAQSASVVADLCCCGGCLDYRSSCNWRFMSSCKVSILGTM